MESQQIFEAFVSEKCPACGGSKRKRNAFCLRCYRHLPNLLKASLWKHFGNGFEEAYHGCLSWFRLHPLQSSRRPSQKHLFEDAS